MNYSDSLTKLEQALRCKKSKIPKDNRSGKDNSFGEDKERMIVYCYRHKATINGIMCQIAH